MTKKIPRQSQAVVSAPPATGPSATAAEPPAAHTATARARRAGSVYSPRGGTPCRTSASEAGRTTAAATPCTTRAPIRAGRFGASPQAAEASVNTVAPTAYARVAPARSENAPVESISAAKARV